MLHLVLCWHFHQPDYRSEEGAYFLPWTYLHALKDYADMAAHLEAAPRMRAVVNFVPTLLEQLDDYARQFAGGELRDPLLAGLIDAHPDRLSRADRRRLLDACFHLNAPTMLEPFPAFKRLHDLGKTVRQGPEEGLDHLSGQYFTDLLTWYHLAWTGETLRRTRPAILELMQKGGGYSLEDRQALFHLIGEVVSGLLPRYLALEARGQVELSSTPHSHPIAPLLIDFRAAREARADLSLPKATAYPGGEERVKAHIQAALATHTAHFGRPPAGFWPAEGGVSAPTLGLFSEAGLRWSASGEGVLRHSLKAAGMDDARPCQWLCRPYRVPGTETVCFFRDDYLSDLIGFEYKNWFARDAVRHFLHSIEDRYHYSPCADPVVAVILDGENAWDFYPYSGWYFLSELYQALAEHPGIRTTTFSDYLDAHPNSATELPHLTAGSWVHGDFTTWMGDPAKNRAWDLLCAAKAEYDAAMQAGALDPVTSTQAEAQLKSCESSDWFWWFGDYNPRDSVEAFDHLYRAKLKRLYALLGCPAPVELDEPICRGGGVAEAGGVMRRG